MRASPLLAAVLSLTLTGCLQAVDLGAADGNSVAKQDGSTPLPDGSVSIPDASTAKPDGSVIAVDDGGTVVCKGPNDCPPVVQTDPICNPMRAACANGACQTERVPRIWDNAPGACQKAAECDCQQLTHDQCLGSFLCTA
ncbi:MAG TPA: hypothetical protein VGK67_30700, partial [Myxococcales bacterium]